MGGARTSAAMSPKRTHSYLHIPGEEPRAKKKGQPGRREPF
jgi:hypothetical protein